MSEIDTENRIDGQVTVDLGGEPRPLRLTIGQIEILENELGVGAVSLLQGFISGKWTVRQLRVVLCEGLRKSLKHPRPDADKVWGWIVDKDNLFDAATSAAELLSVSLGFGAAETEDANPPKAGAENT